MQIKHNKESSLPTPSRPFGWRGYYLNEAPDEAGSTASGNIRHDPGGGVSALREAGNV